MSKKKIGTLYVLSNPCFPYLKIGFTTNSVIDRCRQLSNMQAIPLPFEIVYTAFVEDPWKVEKFIHKHFKNKKVAKEFFDVSLSEVKGIVKKTFAIIDELKYRSERKRELLER